MIPKYRMWDKETKSMNSMAEIYRNRNQEIELHPRDKNIILMQSTGLRDKNGKEIFEGDILKFNDEWNEYCHEGYVDGSVEGINFVEVVRGEACFEFGKTKYPDSSLFILMEDEHLNFKDFIKSEDFEFEINGNVYENPRTFGG